MRISEWAHYLNLESSSGHIYFNFSAQKRGFFRQELEESYISRMAPQRVFLMGFFYNFLEINTHDFIRNHFENKVLFHSKFYGA